MVRPDTYHEVRKHLDEYDDTALEAHFWSLAGEVVAPLVDLARSYTSPSIERSVLMRMGCDSPTCTAVVAECEKRGLLGHGAGHVVLVCMREWKVDALEAARRLAAGNGWEVPEANWAAK